MDNTSTEPTKLFPIFAKSFRPRPPDPLQEMQLTLEKCQSQQQQFAKRRKCLLGKKETPGLSQMVLDAGQKVIGPVYCDECGLLYSPGDIEDEQEHRKAHARLNNIFSIRLWKNANILQEYHTEACVIIRVDCKTESKRVLNILKDFLAWIDSELGGEHDECGSKPSEKIFLYAFRTKRKPVFRILGCAVVETIDQGKVLCDHICSKDDSANYKENVKLLLGLTRLWTDQAFRRKHIASRLIDTIRVSWSIPGFVVPKHQIGILEPSEDGKAFMENYTNKAGWLYTYL